jgi:uncharacterized protein DUF397
MAADVRDTSSNRFWLRSSHCTPKKNCVEVGHDDNGVIIRDSKSNTTLHPVDDVRWTAFLSHCRAIS